MCTMQCNRNFNILINWSKVIARQTGLPRNVCKVQNDENKNWPTLRGSKPNQMNSKRLKIWNIGSLLWILGTPKAASYDTFLGTRYSMTKMILLPRLPLLLQPEGCFIFFLLQMEWSWKTVYIDFSWLKNWHTWSIFRGIHSGTIHLNWPIMDLKLWHPK